jgi:hypothetical protein
LAFPLLLFSATSASLSFPLLVNHLQFRIPFNDFVDIEFGRIISDLEGYIVQPMKESFIEKFVILSSRNVAIEQVWSVH